MSTDTTVGEDGITREGLQTLTATELQELRGSLKIKIANLWAQLEQWNLGTLPDHMMTSAWRSRAVGAKNWAEEGINLVRAEITRRRLEAEEWRPPKETPEQKAARVAATDAAQQTQDRAFICAARNRLSREDYIALWDLARQMFPESFGDQHDQ